MSVCNMHRGNNNDYKLITIKKQELFYRNSNLSVLHSLGTQIALFSLQIYAIRTKKEGGFCPPSQIF